MAGFGSVPADDNIGAGIPVPSPMDNPSQDMAADIHQIKRKYVDGGTNVRLPLQLAINGGTKQDMTGQSINSILVTATSGLIFVYLFDQSAGFGAAAFPPDFVISAGVVPFSVQVMIPEREDYIISFQEGSGSAVARGMARMMKI